METNDRDMNGNMEPRPEANDRDMNGNLEPRPDVDDQSRGDDPEPFSSWGRPNGTGDPTPTPTIPASPVWVPSGAGADGRDGPPASDIASPLQGPPPPPPWGAPGAFGTGPAAQGWNPQQPQWMGSATSWIPLSAGPDAGGYGSPGGHSGGSEAAAAGPQRRNGPARRVLLVLAAVLLLAGVATAGVLIGGNHPAQQSANGTIPNPAAAANSNSNASGGKLSVSSVAARVDPGIVDITSILGSAGVAAGTGMILTSNGDVLTNNHVVDGATSISGQIDGKGPKYRVRVLGTDVTQDVALLRLVGVSGLHTVRIGNSATLAVGDPVVAIGNALDLPGPPTVTAGIVSALGRSINASDEGSGATEHLSGLIQTDAPINPGNSGGALANAAGQVIGMNTAASQGSSTQAATNIGFAIPIDEAISIAQQIEQHKPSNLVQVGQKGYIGVRVEDVSVAENAGGLNPFGGPAGPTPGTQHGAYIVGVEASSPATRVGLQPGDVITGVNGTRVTTAAALGNALRSDQVGTRVSVTWVTPSRVTHSATLRLGSGPTP
jgi:S1-C subfamily serine protease